MCVIAIASPLPSPIKRAEPHSLPRTPPSMTLTLRLPPIARRPQRGLRRWLHHLLLAGAEWRAARARRHPAGRLGPVLPAGQHREPASRGICRLSGHQGCDSHRRALRAPVGPGRESEGERVRCQCDVPAVPRFPGPMEPIETLCALCRPLRVTVVCKVSLLEAARKVRDVRARLRPTLGCRCA